jgi:hypothetical protein
MILFKKQLFDLEVKGQGPTKVIMVHDTSLYGHAPTYQISLTYLQRQKCYGPDKLRWEAEEAETEEEKIRLKQYVSLRLKGRHNYDYFMWLFEFVVGGWTCWWRHNTNPGYQV